MSIGAGWPHLWELVFCARCWRSALGAGVLRWLLACHTIERKNESLIRTPPPPPRTNKVLFSGTIPTKKVLFAGTVLANNSILFMATSNTVSSLSSSLSPCVYFSPRRILGKPSTVVYLSPNLHIAHALHLPEPTKKSKSEGCVPPLRFGPLAALRF